jgi:tetratricopeptide (TPR) repeat protein
MGSGTIGVRIGEILIEASLIDAEKLEEALDYARAKAIPVGGALRALKHLHKDDLKRGLDAQQAMSKGLEPKLAIQVLIGAHEKNQSFVYELKKLQAQLGEEKVPEVLIYWLNAPDSLESTSAGLLKPSVISLAARSPEKLIMQADQFYGSNQLLEAEQLYFQAKQNLVDEGATPLRMEPILFKLANLYLALDRFDDAYQLYNQALQMRVEIYGISSIEVVNALENIGDVYMLQGKVKNANSTFTEALEAAEDLPPQPEIAARLIRKLSHIHAQSGASADPMRIGELAISSGLLTKVQLEQTLRQASQSGEPLGVALRREGFVNEQQMESLMFAQILLRDSPLPGSLVVRAMRISINYKMALRLLAESGKWVPDEMANNPLYKQLVREQERLLSTEVLLGSSDPEVAALAIKVADLHLSRKDRLAAEALLKRAVVILEKLPGERLELVKAYDKLAQAYYHQGKHAEAQTTLLKSLECRRTFGLTQTTETAKCLWLLGKLSMQQATPSDALIFLVEAQGIFEHTASCPAQLTVDIENCRENAKLT